MNISYVSKVFTEIDGANVDQVVTNLIGYLDHDTDGAAAYLVDDIAGSLAEVDGDADQIDYQSYIQEAAENAASDLIYWKDYGEALADHWYSVQEAIDEGIHDIAAAIQYGMARDIEEDLQGGLADIIAAALISYRVKDCGEVMNREDIESVIDTVKEYD